MVREPEVDVGSAVLTHRTAAGDLRAGDATLAQPLELYEGRPVRIFRWYVGQRHYSGEYWSSTERDLVPHESRLEKAILMIADFDPDVHRIVAQPFLLEVSVNGTRVRHTLDYLLGTNAGPVVVDVMRAERYAQDKYQFLAAWTRRVMHSLGWTYVVSTEPEPAVLDNVRFLSGYRREWLINHAVVTELRAQRNQFAGNTLREVEAAFPHRCEALVRSALLHLLWRRELTFDITRPLQPSTRLGSPS